jgi:hypothetical protein
VTAVEPPPELTAAQGGVLLAEAVRDEHKVAWLISAAILGDIDLETAGDTISLVRLRRADGATERLLETAFASRARLPLDTYDPYFARAWALIGDELETWQRWDRTGDTRRTRALVLGSVVGLGGLAFAALGGAATSRWGLLGLAIVLMGGILAGGGLAAVVRGRELRVRTPQGTGLWLRVESFRRFVTGAHAYPTGDPTQREPSPDYTDWAISLGESDQWLPLSIPSDSPPADIRAYQYAVLVRTLRRGIEVASTEPCSSDSSSSRGGGGGGRRVGGSSGGARHLLNAILSHRWCGFRVVRRGESDRGRRSGAGGPAGRAVSPARPVRQHVQITAAPNSGGANADAKVLSLVAAMCAGADNIVEADRLRHAGMATVFGGVRAPSTLGTFLRSFTWGHVLQLHAAHRQSSWPRTRRSCRARMRWRSSTSIRPTSGCTAAPSRARSMAGSKATARCTQSWRPCPRRLPGRSSPRCGCAGARPPTCAGPRRSWPRRSMSPKRPA